MDTYKKLIVNFCFFTLVICAFSGYIANINIYLGALSLFGLMAINFLTHELITRHNSKNNKTPRMPHTLLGGVLSSKRLPLK
ncbi:hypothetical protein HZI73_26100 (plasmid) [Vallitalea pronyensis]|uniref:Uncharacterized protein n=1 Tax=Vallitalea pronyensis TaxID=1348613 RepID=A0A8J8SJV4_9FIRM|nr:hypothetical protein [Vallitalea pronyensis]QUI25887.1 hypothetical protein HZI73_26100 [Vallitalea pronyensis]